MITRRDVALGIGASLLAVPACSRVESLTTESLEAERRNAGSPALAVAAVAKGHAPRTWAVGERLLGSGVAVTARDVWHLGSITKSMTATLVARLVEAGVVHWDDTVGELLRSVAPDMHEVYRSASFRHLLSHHAGMPKDIPMPLFMTYSRDATNVREERRNYAREALRMTPVGAKAAAFSYSNNGYVVVGAMLEASLDTTWEELVRRHVFEPLKLASAGVGPPGERGKLTQPAGHFLRNGRLSPVRVGEDYADNPYAIGPCGRVHMSLGDALSYLSAHREGIPFLKRETWQTLHTPPFGGKYAMGWVTESNGDVWHDGSNTAWYAHALFNKRAGVAAVAATNEGRPQSQTILERISRRARVTIGRQFLPD